MPEKQLGLESHFEWADENEGAPRYVILRQGRTELHLSQNQHSLPSTTDIFIHGVQDYHDIVSGTLLVQVEKPALRQSGAG